MYTIIKTDEGVLAIPSYVDFVMIRKFYPEMEILKTGISLRDITKDVKIVKKFD